MSSNISHRIPLRMHLQTLRMHRITWPMRRGQIFPTYLKPLIPIIQWATCMAVIPKIVCRHVLKTTAICACAKSVSLEWDGRSVTTIILGNHDFLLMVSNFGDLAALRAATKIQNGLPFWCRLTQVVLEKRPLNRCCTSSLKLIQPSDA